MLSRHHLSFTLVVSVCCCLPGKDHIAQRCKTTPDREQYLATWSEAALIHSCQWIYRSPFPLCEETQRQRTASRWPLLKPDRPNPKRYLPAPLQTTLLSRGCGWKRCQPTIVLVAIDKLLFYIHKMSVGLVPDKYSGTQASDLPRGTFTSFCT